VFTGATWQRCKVHFLLDVSLRAMGRPPRSLPSDLVARHGSTSCWPPLGAPVTRCRACREERRPWQWLERSLRKTGSSVAKPESAALSIQTHGEDIMPLDERRSGVVGCDPHKRSVTTAAIDATGVFVGVATFDNDPAGMALLLAWVGELDVAITRIGIEGSGGWGLHVAAVLASAGYDVREVPAPRTADRRARGRRPKTDREDAFAIAREVLADPRLSPAPAMQQCGEVHAEIAVICDRRRSLVRRRQRLINEAEGVLNKLPLALICALPGRGGVMARLRALHGLCTAPTCTDRSPAEAELVAWALELRGNILGFESLIKQLEARLPQLLAERGSTLTQEFGIGIVSAAELVAQVGDARRFRSESAFARWCGVAPVAVSSGEGAGQPRRHRLDLLGNRAVNRILYTMSVTQASHHPPGREFLQRKRHEGKSLKEARRAHKRLLANRVIRRMWADTRNTRRTTFGCAAEDMTAVA